MNKFTDIDLFISWVESQKRFSPKASLDKMNYYCSLFNHPERTFKSIHITGTNGKGSTVAFLKSILQESGLKVATFTSPYITIFNERIQFDGKFISDSDLLKYGNKIIDKYPLIEKSKYETPSFFEFITLLAFLYFEDLPNLDIAIIEVGIGGRLDATNVIDSLVSVITNVSLEHTNVLGDTTKKITEEKLGIVKNKEPLICGIKDIDLQNYVIKRCQDKESELVLTSLSAFEIKQMDINGSRFTLEGYDNPFFIKLIGPHQVENAIVAIKAIEKLNQIIHFSKWNFPISNVILSRGLKNATWPGRLEVLSSKPLILTDGAHNIDGIERVCEFIKNQNYKYKRAVVSISKDKELATMIKLLDDTFDEIIFTEYNYKRHASADDLYKLSNNPRKRIIKSLNEVYNYIGNNHQEITIFLGSLYLVTDVKRQII